MSDWTTPAAIKAQVRHDWDRGRVLAARADGESMFPRATKFKRPETSALGSRFAEVQQWIEALVAGSRSAKGRGYEIEWEEVMHRQLGRNQVPRRIVIPSDEDAAFLAGKLQELKQWDALTAHSLALFPTLRAWLRRRPLAVLEHAAEWEGVLAVMAWFVANPRSGLYLRELDIPGVDTKFVEQRRGILGELLETVLAQESIRLDARGFEARHGIKTRPLRIRFRFLDPALTVGGHSDIETAVETFARHPLPVDRVIVVENEINFLSFPSMSRALVVWGGGYSVDRLASIAWLASRQVIYWGDIDTHGFGILSRLRGIHPHVGSFLMDRTTLIEHSPLWATEEKPRTDDLPGLISAERALYNDLRFGTLGPGVRLEQERIRFTIVRAGADTLVAPSPPASWVDASRTRNWVLDDPLLDWLDRYGAANGFPRDDLRPGFDPSLDFDTYLREKNSLFRQSVLAEIAGNAQITAVKDVEGAADLTAKYMAEGRDVIVGGVLCNPRTRVRARPFLLVRGDRCSALFPGSELPPRFPADKYVAVQVVWRELHVDEEGRLDCASEQLPLAVEAWCVADALGEVQEYVAAAQIVGRRRTIARVELAHRAQHRDRTLSVVASGALDWLRRFEEYGASWAPLPTPTVPELYPHVRNSSDSPWRFAKRAIARELQELTLLPGMNPERRRRAHEQGLLRWTDQGLSATAVGLSSEGQVKRFEVVLAANRSTAEPLLPPSLGASLPWRVPAAAEFFVDFEMASDPDDERIRRIVQIGCGKVVAERWRFMQWTVDALNNGEERRILDAWMRHLRAEAGADLDTAARIFHWSSAERAAIDSTFTAARVRYPDNDWPATLPWTDVLAPFRAVPIGIKGAFDYGLKSIANAMRAEDLITASWEQDSLDGLGAMVGFARAADAGGKISAHPGVSRIARYNEEDCRALMEIVGWLRDHR